MRGLNCLGWSNLISSVSILNELRTLSPHRGGPKKIRMKRAGEALTLQYPYLQITSRRGYRLLVNFKRRNKLPCLFRKFSTGLAQYQNLIQTIVLKAEDSFRHRILIFKFSCCRKCPTRNTIHCRSALLKSSPTTNGVNGYPNGITQQFLKRTFRRLVNRADNIFDMGSQRTEVSSGAQGSN
jgi:hypothetical protein